jgi:hypothetical protein
VLNRKKVSYWKLALPGAIVAATFIRWITREGFGARQLLLLAVVALVILVQRLQDAKFERGPKLKISSAYLAATTSLLLVICALPSVTFFKIAYDTEVAVFVKYMQVQTHKSLVARTERLRDEYREMGPERLLNRLKSRLDVYQAFLPIHVVAPPLQNPFPLNSVAQRYCREKNQLVAFLGMIRPLYNETSTQTQEFMHDTAADCSYAWQDDAGLLALRAPLPGGLAMAPVRVPLLRMPENLPWWGAMGLIVVGMVLVCFSVCRYLAEKLFLIDLLAEKPAAAAHAGKEEWDKMSLNEKLVLWELRDLFSRGLIVREPALRVCSAHRKVALDKGEKDCSGQTAAERKWDAVKWPVFGSVLGVALFLFLSQRDTFDKSMVFVTVIGSGMAGVFNILNFFKNFGGKGE